MLAVAVGPQVTVAAVDRGGHRSAVLFGDRVALPTPVVADDSGLDLYSALAATRPEAAEPVIAAVAQHLRVVGAQAGPVGTLVLTTPPGWGSRRRDMLVTAGQRAGFGTVQVVAEPAAVAAGSFPAAGDHAVVLVCLLGEQASQVSVLRRAGGGWETVATQPARDATGVLLHDALAVRLDLPRPVTDSLAAQLTAARARLSEGEPAALAVGGMSSAVTVTPADLQLAAAPLHDAVAQVVLDTLDAAEVDAARLIGVMVYGEAAQVLAPSPDLLGVPVTVAADGRLATVYGALDSVQPSSAVLGAWRVGGRWWRYPGSLAAPLICSAAAGLLVWQMFDIVARLMPPETSRLSTDYEKLTFYFDTAAFALAGLALTMTFLTAGRTLAAALLADPSPAHARQAGRIYAFGGLVGLMSAVLQGLLAQTVIGGPDNIAPPYVNSAVAGAAVPATVAIVTGLAAPWLRGFPLWTERVGFPSLSLVLAVAGVMAVNAEASGLPIDGVPYAVKAVLGVAGAGLLGVAIALVLVTQPSARLVLATLMGAACMVIVGYSNLHTTIVLYLIAVAVWWIRRTARIVADNIPTAWRRRFTVTSQNPDSQSIR